MEPYYKDDWVRVHNEDCRLGIHLLEAVGHALVSDPPYGINADFERQGLRKSTTLEAKVYYSRDWKSIGGDDEPFDPAHLLGFPVIALFGANHYADKLPASSKWLIWDKRCGSARDDNSDAELIWTNQKGAARIHYQKWRGIVREGEENLSRGRKLHPAQKPVSLMRWVIGQLKLEPGTVIVDPYMGSGSTLVAAKQLGYRSIGFERVTGYCETAVQRLAQEVFEFSA